MVRNGLIFALLAFGALCLASFAQTIDLDSNQTMMVPTCSNIGPSETLLQNSLHRLQFNFDIIYPELVKLHK